MYVSPAKIKKKKREGAKTYCCGSFFPLVFFPGGKQNHCVFQKHCCDTLFCFHFVKPSWVYCTNHFHPLYRFASMISLGNLSRAFRSILQVFVPSLLEELYRHSCLFLLSSLNGKFFKIKSIVCCFVCLRILQPDFQKILASVLLVSRKRRKFRGIEVRIPSCTSPACMYLEISGMKPISVPPDLTPGEK